MYCRQCGYNNDNYSKMCKRCGSDLHEPPVAFTRLSEAASGDAAQNAGGLRLAPKKESLSAMLKKRFGKLRRATRVYTSKRAVIITVAVILFCVLALLLMIQLRSCGKEAPAEYANDSGSILSDCFAAEDSEFLFYSVPYGSNTGLYRTTLSTGQTLKLCYRTLTCMSVWGDWVYGLDEHGTPLRISRDGTVTQPLTDLAQVSHLTLVDNYCYFIGSDYRIYRALLDPLDEGGMIEPECLCSDYAGAIMVQNGRIYYTAATLVERFVTPTDVSATELRTKLVPQCSSTGKPYGALCSMNFDGSDVELIVNDNLFSASVHGDYLYFFTESTETVSYSDVHPEVTETTASTKKPKKTKKTTTTEPPPKNIDVIRLHSWRYSTRTSGYATFLPDDSSISPIYVSGGSIYYVSKDGDLTTASLAGLDAQLVPTGLQNVDSVFVLGDQVYFRSDSESIYGRISKYGKHPEILSQNPDY